MSQDCDACCVVLPAGGRSSQAIVDAALSALRSLVKERLSGKTGGSDYNREVQKSEHIKHQY